LKPLLERHLDLARLPTLAAGIEIGEAELARLIDATPAQARDLLQTEGHFDAKVTVEAPTAPGTADAPARIRVDVDPGPLTRVSRFGLEVEGDLARAVAGDDREAVELLASLRGAWPLKAGSVFRNADWSAAKGATLARLRAAGYAAATFSGTSAQVDVEQHEAQLYLVADAGPLFRSGEIVVEGLGLHDRRVVENLARFAPGTVVTEELLLDFQDRLAKSGLFEFATVRLDSDPEAAGAARVVVRVKELLRHQLTLGVGVSSNTGPRATVEHFDRRVFGWPATARNKIEWGRSRQAWDGEISTYVRADSYRWFIGPTIERLKTDTDVVLTQRIRIGRALEHARIERRQYLEWDQATRRTSIARTVNDAVTLNQGWIWRDIDNPLLPTDGQAMSLLLGVGQARDSVNGSSPLLRGQARITVYRPLGGGWLGQARLEAGQVFVKGAVTIADSLGFRAGGDDSVRGYAYRSLGPLRDGAVASGKVLITGSAEVAHPLTKSMPDLLGAVFIDAGDAADSWRAISPVLGYGVGVRYRSPVGPLRVDIAYGQEVRRLRLHFSVGIVF
jgi:translocation and assembly module TamA